MGTVIARSPSVGTATKQPPGPTTKPAASREPVVAVIAKARSVPRRPEATSRSPPRRFVFTVVHFDDSIGDYQDDYFSQIDDALLRNPVSGANFVFSPANNLFRHRLTMKSAKVFEFD